MTRLALAIFFILFGIRVSNYSSNALFSFRFFVLALWLALHFVINHGNTDEDQHRNFLWNTASVTALALGLAGLFTGGAGKAIERASYSIVETVAIVLITRVSSVDGGWDYHSQSGLAVFSVTGLAQVLLCAKLLLGRWCGQCCGACCGNMCDDCCSADDDEDEDPEYRARVNATTHLHLQQMREDLLHNMNSVEYENYLAKLSPAGLKSLEHFLQSGQQCTAQQREHYDGRNKGSCWANEGCGLVAVAAFSVALCLSFYDTFPFWLS